MSKATVINKWAFGGHVPSDAVNIMRGTEFGNKYYIGTDGTRDEVIAKYKRWLWRRIESDREFRGQVKALHGKRLCCSCAPQACHGNVLADAAEYLNNVVIPNDN